MKTSEKMRSIFKMEYRDKYGCLISAEELEDKLRSYSYKIVKQESWRDYFVSTVWLGVPHGLHAEFYFETMIFNHANESDPLDSRLTRYRTLEEAEIGHEKIMSDLKTGRLLDK